MTRKQLHTLLTGCIAAIWLANGLFCKILHLVPRHGQIVARILGPTYAPALTVGIGVLETAMAVWIISGLWHRFNAWLQIGIIALMNLLEAILVPDLLLWGRWNAFFAFLLVVTVYCNEFYIRNNTPNTRSDEFTA